MNIEIIPGVFFGSILEIILLFLIILKFGKSKATLFGCAAYSLAIIWNFFFEYAINIANNGEPELSEFLQSITLIRWAIYSVLIILMFIYIPTGNNIGSDKFNSLELTSKKSLEEFSKYYLTNLRVTLTKFGNYFSIVGAIIVLQLILGLFFLLSMIGNGGDNTILLNGIQQALSFSMLVWLALLAKRMVNLQTEKVENEMLTTIEHRREVKLMAENILKSAEEKAETKITINGNNSILALNGSKISGVTQKYSVEGDGELIKSLALLVSYCETVGDKEAIESANKLSEEATKPDYDKGIVFDLWNNITSSIPQVTKIVEIAHSVKGLFL